MALVLAGDRPKPPPPRGNLVNGKRHINVPQRQLRPTPEEWPETYDDVYARISLDITGATPAERLRCAEERVASYSWCTSTCMKINPFLYDCYLSIRNELQREVKIGGQLGQ